MSHFFSGKTALVIGGSSGIGRAVALQLAERGAQVLVVGRNEAKLAETQAACPASVATLRADITDKAGLHAVVDAVNTRPTHFDLLVNAAGVFSPKAYLDHSEADYDAYLGISKALFFATQAVARRMVVAQSGAIVNIGSMWAKQAILATPSSAYSMAKAGVHAMTQHLAMELGAHHIRVNAVSPGIIYTDIHASGGDPQRVDRVKESVPMKRGGYPEEVAKAVLWLLSEDASYTTGASIDVAGGR